ncbi:hypothetical protein FACS1894217_11980 [Clostridia bacterium]|nr:hypothetical protein FACS1894217_11980 [Clostridia bacterium]
MFSYGDYMTRTVQIEGETAELERHHVFGGANRKKSEDLGEVVNWGWTADEFRQKFGKSYV